MSDEDRRAPLQTLRDGAVVVKLWRQESEKGPFVTATIGRTYQNRETGEYSESRSLGGTDVLKAQALLQEAHREIGLWRQHFRETEPQPQARENDRGLTRERDAAMAKAPGPAPAPRGRSRER